MLLLREKLQEQHRTQELSKLDKEASNLFRRQAGTMAMQQEELSQKERNNRDDKQLEKTESASSLDMECDREKELTTRCLKLLMQGRLSKEVTPKVQHYSFG